MKNLTFGIEIELTGISREAAAKAVAGYFGISAHYLGGGYDKWIAPDNQGRSWQIMNDSSISPEIRQNGRRTVAGLDHRVELVSPICTYQDIETVQEITRVLRKTGSFCNRTCAIHLHVGKERFNARTLRNLVNIIASKEDLIYQALQVDRDRERRYCQKVKQSFLAELNRQKPKELDELADLWYQGYNDRRSTKYHPSRYYGLNLHAVFHGPTVEYRFFNGVVNHAGVVKAYIQFCLAISHQALSQKSASAKKTQTSNPKYTFRTWLLRLGLIGKEFETARLHLLKNLEGDSAFRNGRQAAGL
jgi:hypothetical protein